MSPNKNKKTARSLYLVHFNIRKNGGNFVLSHFATDLSAGLKMPLIELSLKTDFLKVLRLIFSRELVVFSNPILVFFFSHKKRSLHFIQSIDEELFSPSDFGFLKAYVFRFLLLVCMRLSRSMRVYNSRFTAKHYRFLSRSIGRYETEHNLYFEAHVQESFERPVVKDFHQCVWIGTSHTRKGFADVLELARNEPQFSFKCIFSGRVQKLEKTPCNLEILENLDHSQVFEIVRKSNVSVVTSSFESLSLPIYEGLLCRNKIIARESDYLRENGVMPYISTYTKADDIRLLELVDKPRFVFKNVSSSNEALVQAVSNAL